MKNFIYLASIATAILIAPLAAKAQGYPYGGASTTTIYVPSTTETTTTTTIIQSAPTTSYPYNNSFPNTTTTTYYGSGYPVRGYRQYRQPTVIFPQQNIYYPRAIQSTCSTSIIGSPIPSAVPLNSVGQPCR
jgi:hypothetical protein